MDPRQQESSQGKEAKQPFRRMRSPPRPRITGSFRPRFGGRFFRPRFIRDDHSFRKPRFSFGFQRYHPFTPRPRFNWRDQSGPPQGPPCPNNQYNDQRNMDRSGPARASTPKEHSSALRSSAGPSREKEKQPVSFIVAQEKERSHSKERERDRELPSTISRATARNRAIQQKRREIEQVYRQDCDTFGVVVKMLIAKDPSLERPIQPSLKENLGEIGLRCVEAMQQFIEEYDTREPSPQ
ncbi:periphilin-1 isoform X1 [Salmo salar]|uniref:Periphilin-1 isoform X1 n=1 Tax=Salmo salar TaxID=8030 RepID=A0A1S3MCB5_SALSA|nr:periphilin-1 isoform X1 [Salmo salar]|eukprot:XP_014000822.1 PREDICTED: periphilin-1 isoform X1 [Salmo salar]